MTFVSSFRLLTGLILGAALWPASGHAQNAAGLKLTFSIVLWENAGNRKIEFQNGSKTTVMALPAEGRSGEFSYDGPTPLVFFETIPAEPKPVRKILATADIPPDWTQAMLVFFRAPAGSPAPYLVMPVRNDTAGIPLNHAKLINISGQAIAAKVLDQVYSVPARGSALVDYSGAVHNDLPVSLATEVDGQNQMVLTTGYAAFPGTRKTLLAFPSPRNPKNWRVLEIGEPTTPAKLPSKK